MMEEQHLQVVPLSPQFYSPEKYGQKAKEIIKDRELVNDLIEFNENRKKRKLGKNDNQ